MDKISYEEFYDYVWSEYISERVIPNKFIRKNKELVQSITYNVYHIYKQSSNISETVFAKIIEQVIRDILIFGVEDMEDEDDNFINEGFESF